MDMLIQRLVLRGEKAERDATASFAKPAGVKQAVCLQEKLPATKKPAGLSRRALMSYRWGGAADFRDPGTSAEIS
jgi:hypothetical protein